MIIESWKREAMPTYEGTTGYQPVLGLWAEMNAVVADEFRDGNVPAAHALLPVAQRAFQALPETVTQFYFRGDSAWEEDGLLTWLRDEKRQDGPQSRIGFAVSARMNAALAAEIGRVPEAGWQPYSEDATAIKECAEVVDYARREPREPLPRAAALCGHPHPQKAGRAVRRRQRGEAFRGDQQLVGVAGEETASVASREGRIDRSRA